MNITYQPGIYDHFFDPFSKKERCGLLFGTSDGNDFDIREVEEVPNRSTRSSKEFSIVRRDMVAALQRTGRAESDIIGYLHTHHAQGDHPSYADVLAAVEGKINVVVHVPSRLIIYFNNDGYLGEHQ
jgi:proteasome lid subunit RPN8/RPN11